eukprot:16444250-Heterocapsa_arctica.AAC.1
MRFFDIEKAYPRVCKDALWKLMHKLGCPDGMIKVCRALHEFTEMHVRIHGGLSSGYLPDKGLREGCPSSPALFNLYHFAVMIDFRIRRAAKAEERGMVPGLIWKYKVDEKLTHGVHERKQDKRPHFRKVIIGDVLFADDTVIIGTAGEIRGSEGAEET